MMRKFSKSDKVSDLLRHAVSNALLFELNIEKLKWVTVTEVRVNKDMKVAEIFYTVLESQVTKDEALELIEKNAYLVKRYISQNLRLRHTPDLRFKYDDVEEKASHIEEILSKLPKRKEDGQ